MVDRICSDGIKPRVRLVIEDTGRPPDDCPGKGDPFAHAPREFRRKFLLLAGHADNCQGRGDVGSDLGILHQAVFAKRKCDIFRHIERIKQRSALE